MMASSVLVFLVPLLLSVTLALPISNSSSPCARWCGTSELGFDVIVTSSTYYAANTLDIDVSNGIPFCRIYAQRPYGNNNTLNFEIWLPEDDEWNGRFVAVGNSGMAGSIDTFNMVPQLNKGFAVAAGDGGHLASLNNDGTGAPDTYLPYLHSNEQVRAWIHDSIAIFTPAAKKVVSLQYGESPRWSYYYGCSTGGAQGFALAQLWPDLFDGIYAGSPGFWYSHLALSFLWNALHTQGDAYLDQDALDLITSAVLDQCDGLDGVYDRLLENPLECDFSIDYLACGFEYQVNGTCLTPAQLAAAEAIYAGPKDVRDRAEVYPGFAVGSEVEWAAGQEGILADQFSIPILQNLVFDDLSYDAATFNWGSDIDIVDRVAGVLIDETSVDLEKFRDLGGKMISHQGWADPYNAATLPIQYLDRLEGRFGDEAEDFFTLFMVPGGGHCGAASYYPSVPATYDFLGALVLWVEQGERPIGLLSSDPPDGSNRTRKLCAWPRTAKYVGGDVDLWTSYECRY